MRSTLAMESIQTVRARSSVLARPSAIRQGADPVVMTTSGRSRARMRSDLDDEHREAEPVAAADVADRVVGAARHVGGQGGIHADVEDLELRRRRG